VSPANIRGRLVSLNQMAIVTGILAAYAVNWLLSAMGPSSWRWMFASAALPSAAFFVALLFVPESPRWLTESGRAGEALAILSRIGGPDRAAAELKQIEEAIAAESGSFAELFRPALRRPLVLAVALAILQQITGINTVLFYGSILFKEHGGAGDSSAIAANVIVGGINFLATIVALWIIDKVGRKALLMVSAAGMAVAELSLGAAFLMHPPPSTFILAIVLVCVACFAIGLGPGVWVLLSELFPTRIRGRAMSVATISLWAACVALTFSFLSLVRAITVTGAFWLYAAMCITTVVLVWRAAPETKGKTLEEIEALWLTAPGSAGTANTAAALRE
jgi:MFS transporter, SP family, arabinose:H+ symporter